MAQYENLRPYQQAGVGFLYSARRAILADDPGLGKTAQALFAAEGRTLVVSAAILESVWRTEHQLWEPSLDMTWTSYGLLFDRIPAGTNKAGQIKRKGVGRPKSELIGYDSVIFDEGHALKNRKALSKPVSYPGIGPIIDVGKAVDQSTGRQTVART